MHERFTLVVPEDLRAELDRRATEQDRSRNYIIISLIRAALEAEEGRKARIRAVAKGARRKARKGKAA